MALKKSLIPNGKILVQSQVQRQKAQNAKGLAAGQSAPLEPDEKPRTSSAALQLQQMVGNRAARQLIQGKVSPGAIQTKLTVGPAQDAFEQEADQVAEQVLSTPAPNSPVQRAAEEEELQSMPVQRAAEEEELQSMPIQRAAEEEEELQAMPIQRAAEEEELQSMPVQRAAEEEEELQAMPIQRKGPGAGFEASPEVEEQIANQKGGGEPLPAETRSQMEPRFGADFSGVRLHTDSGAAQVSQAINAQAFTRGSDIFMGAGKYDPGSSEGKKLLAHELTHVIQQGSAKSKEETPPPS